MLRLRTLFGLVVLISIAIVGAGQESTGPSADQVWSDLTAGNHRFVIGKPATHDFLTQRKQLTKSQHPAVAVLSCADSRVPPELIFDAGLGDMFVVRAAGEDDDPLTLGSLEYAVEHLGSSVIVVLAHQSCGAVTAACSGGKSESVNLDAVVTPIAPSCVRGDPSNPASLDLAIRDHAHRVAQEILDRSKLIKSRLDDHKVTIIEAYYSLDTGEVTRLR